MASVSTLGQALRQIELITGQAASFDDLSTQLTTGKKTQSFSGLGNDALFSQRARADFSSLDNFLTNIDRANIRIDLMLDAIEEFKAQTENLLDSLIQLPNESSLQQGEVVYWDDPTTTEIENIAVGMTSGEPSVEMEIVQDIAGNLLNFMQDLLNIKDGDRFLLHGSETLTPPYLGSSVLDAAIGTLQSGWRGGTISNAELIADLRERDATTNADALTDTIVGYSAPLSADTVQSIFVRVSEVSEIDYTALANDTGFRDVMVALSYLSNPDLGPVENVYENGIPDGSPIPPEDELGAPGGANNPGGTAKAQRENFFEIIEAISAMVSNALDDIDQVRFELEAARAQLGETRESHLQVQAVLLNTISDVEDIDQNEVALQINTLQIQLDASYRVIARVRELSLTNFI